jgi:hypothetical protein
MKFCARSATKLLCCGRRRQWMRPLCPAKCLKVCDVLSRASELRDAVAGYYNIIPTLSDPTKDALFELLVYSSVEDVELSVAGSRIASGRGTSSNILWLFRSVSASRCPVPSLFFLPLLVVALLSRSSLALTCLPCSGGASHAAISRCAAESITAYLTVNAHFLSRCPLPPLRHRTLFRSPPPAAAGHSAPAAAPAAAGVVVAVAAAAAGCPCPLQTSPPHRHPQHLRTPLLPALSFVLCFVSRD